MNRSSRLETIAQKVRQHGKFDSDHPVMLPSAVFLQASVIYATKTCSASEPAPSTAYGSHAAHITLVYCAFDWDGEATAGDWLADSDPSGDVKKRA